MSFVDHLLVVLLFIAHPVYGYFESKRHEARMQAGEVFDRLRFYRDTALAEWAFLAVLAAVWILYGRSAQELGFVAAGGLGFGIGTGIVCLLVFYLFYAVSTSRRSNDAEKAKQVENIGKTITFLPHTDRELRGFYGVSITAGIVEEIVYRGFVLWYLGHFMPLWAAVIVSSIAFGLAHGYQGASGALRCGLVGLAFGIVYVVTGSIWVPILAHILLDAFQGAAIRELLRSDGDSLDIQPA